MTATATAPAIERREVYAPRTPVIVTVPAKTTATAWLNAFLATGQEDMRAVLYQTIAIEFFRDGVQFIGCNGTALFRAWVPTREALESGKAGRTDWPALSEVPYRSVVVRDLDGFGVAFMRTLMSASETYHDLTMQLSADEEDMPPLGEELAAERLVLRGCEQRIDLKLYEQVYPNWREARLGADDVERVEDLSIGTKMLALVGKLKEVSRVDLEFYGEKRHVAFAGRGIVHDAVRGLLMPMAKPKEKETTLAENDAH